MHDIPLLFGLGDTVVTNGSRVTLLGHARFSYGRGFWDEFWGHDQSGDSCWLSVDEGDIVLQHPTSSLDSIQDYNALTIGKRLFFNDDTYTITELDIGECVALRGSFEELLQIGETYRFFNAQSERNNLLSGEFWDGGQSLFVGQWSDPFAIQIEKAA
jgi:hypothetical protein